jgi:hypothetical protein
VRNEKALAILAGVDDGAAIVEGEAQDGQRHLLVFTLGLALGADQKFFGE